MENEVFQFSESESQSPVKKHPKIRLKKRSLEVASKTDESKENKRDKILKSFEFMQPDEDPFILISEESENDSDSEIDLETRKLAGFVNEIEVLKDAFADLETEDITPEEFLSNEYVRKKFGTVFSMIRSFNQGALSDNVEELWIRYWKQEVKITKAYIPILNSDCITCGLKRHLTHKVTEISTKKILGYIGSDCFSFKFRLLMKLTRTCKECNFDDFQEWIETVLDPLLDEISSASANMKKYYRDKKF